MQSAKSLEQRRHIDAAFKNQNEGNQYLDYKNCIRNDLFHTSHWPKRELDERPFPLHR